MATPMSRGFKFWSKLAGLLVVALGWWLASPHQGATTGQPLEPGAYPVQEVVDGDTIVVKTTTGPETVRLIGVDTPETKDPRKPVQCFGPQASDHTKSLLAGKSVKLVSDPQDSDRDKYHRLLRYVYLGNGTLLNRQLIADGYGFAYTVFPYTKIDEFKTTEAQARDQKIGLWSACAVDTSSQIKQTLPK